MGASAIANYHINKQTKMLQQMIPIMIDLKALFTGISSDISGRVGEDDKRDIGVMSRALHIMISDFRAWFEILKSQESDVQNSGSTGAVLDNIASTLYQVLSDGNT